MPAPDDADAILVACRMQRRSAAARRRRSARAAHAGIHDDAIHRQHAAGRSARRGSLFDALELARLDALGARWLAGVARNLLAHPGRGQRRRPLAGVRSCSADARRRTEKRPLVDAIARCAATRRARCGLARLTTDSIGQRRFADASAADGRVAPSRTVSDAALDAAQRSGVPLAEPAASSTSCVRSSSTPTRVARGKRRQPGERTGRTTRRFDVRAPRNSHAARPGNRAATASSPPLTTASSMPPTLVERRGTRRPAGEARGRTERHPTVVARLAKRLMRVLMARQVREWRFDLDEGVLDGSRLAPLVASRGAHAAVQAGKRIALPQHGRDAAHRPLRFDARTADADRGADGRDLRARARALRRAVRGARLHDARLGRRRAGARVGGSEGYPTNPGRLNALEHIIVKAADVPWRRARAGLGLFLHDEMLKENIDGEAARLGARPADGALGAAADPRRRLRRHADGRSDGRRQRLRLSRRPPASGRARTSKRSRRSSSPLSASATTSRASMQMRRRSRRSNSSVRR